MICLFPGSSYRYWHKMMGIHPPTALFKIGEHNYTIRETSILSGGVPEIFSADNIVDFYTGWRWSLCKITFQRIYTAEEMTDYYRNTPVGEY